MNTLALKLKKFTHTLFPKGTANPHTQWIILLRGFWVVAIGLALFSFYLFQQIKTDQMFQTSTLPAPAPVVIQDVLLQKVTGSFELKTIRAKALETTPFVYPDPSMK